ncbi:type III restriction endonuclease subunit R [Paucibacter sp. DJ4R-1]|nr:type III restriction endonuclease subunit R [Paucibacter sp. DJ4R-1]
MGKTRIAVALARAVASCGGRVAILIPPGLGYQWQDELAEGQVQSAPLLRSLDQFYKAWSTEPSAKPWTQHQVMLVSHNFANWRKREESEWWRWGLLSEVVANVQKVRTQYPHGYRDFLDDQPNRCLGAEVYAAGLEIAHAINSNKRLSALFTTAAGGIGWKDTRCAADYSREGRLRGALEQCVGLGMGTFDLVVLDEAHKSRGAHSGVERLLTLVVGSRHCRRLAMTATPVELEATQWMQVLRRIEVDPTGLENSIRKYSKAAKEVRQSPSTATVRDQYKEAAVDFYDALGQFLLRRDKRENPVVKAFSEKANLPISQYRREAEIAVEPRDMSLAWRRAVCAAEALSLAASGGRDPAAQRLRLTISNGHGINEILDRSTCDDELDEAQKRYDANEEKEGGGAAPAAAPAGLDTKQAQRIEWWKKVACSTFSNGQDALFDHPGVAAAVRAIEDADRQDEKVLVFGRFTRPMRTLVELLNARMMLRCLDRGTPWPQSSIYSQEWPAVQVAQQQLNLFSGEGRGAIDARLKDQYETLERSRQTMRTDLLPRLEEGLSARSAGILAVQMFEAMKDSHRGIASVTRAIGELLGESAGKCSAAEWAEQFEHLVLASAERDESRDLDDGDVLGLWAKLADRLDEEYSRPEGGFARLMYGGTKHATRRLLQLAFNRPHSYPRVLVAQSVVGREGLNLHRACRTVLLLHPEWNPAVVEQQIGRVDRLGSRWEQLIEGAEESTLQANPPRIEVLPIVVKGTYDEHQWTVLRERWNDLRAQLHGIVIPPSVYEGDEMLAQLAAEINSAAPDFSPRD